jgi:D-amino peptidase
MKVYVITDMEGISGICRKGQVSRGDPLYAQGRHYMTQDINACVEGCLAGGATQVVVQDTHGGSSHVIWEDLDPRAEYVIGRPGGRRFDRIEEFDGLILLGYHAMAGTPEAILEHTMSSVHWQNLWLGGRKCGEIGIDAAIAADNGVPTIMVSGDDKACHEAEEFLPGVVTACVKTGLALEGGRLLSMKAAHKVITESASDAVQKIGQIEPVVVDKPVTLRLEYVSRGQVPAHGEKPYVKVIDGRTFEVTGDTVEEALWRLT